MITNRAEQQSVPREFRTVAVGYAQTLAMGAFYLLRKWGATQEEIESRPPALMLELGALWYIDWLSKVAEASGVKDPDLPNYQEAEADVLDRIQNDPKSFATIDGANLSRRMFRFQLNNVAWTAPTVCGHEPNTLFLVKTDDEDFIELIAEFCWKNRRKN